MHSSQKNDSDNRNEDVNAQFAQLQQDYLAKLPGKYRDIDDNWKQYQQGPADDADLMLKLYRALHSVAGTSSVLGLDQVADLARKAELVMTGKEQLNGDEQQLISTLLSELKALIESGNITIREINLSRPG